MDEDLPGSPGAYARNWRRILLVDASIGVGVAAVGGAIVAVSGNLLGWVPVVLGIAYVFAIIGRYRVWKQRRLEAGLDG